MSMKRKFLMFDGSQTFFGEDGILRRRCRQSTLIEEWNDGEEEEGVDAPSVF